MKLEDFDEAWLERYWAKVDKSAGPDGCWIWTAAKNSDGYGSVQKPKGKGVTGTHRLAILISGRVFTKEESYALHSCHNPSCVNPAHLRTGSQKDNVKDCVEAGRRNNAAGDANGSRTMPERLARGENHYSRTRPELVARGDANGSRAKPERLARGARHGSVTSPHSIVRGCAHFATQGHYRLNAEGRKIPCKLTEAKVSSIREMGKVLGCGVSRVLIGMILRRDIWRDIA
jgi:hypothetical protein